MIGITGRTTPPQRIRKGILLSLFVGAFSQTAYTSENDPLFELSLEELLQIKVVTAASGYEQKLADAPGSVTVITKHEWQAAGARALEDVLDMVPGVHISKTTTGLVANKSVIRGISGTFGQQVLVLIDGIPIKYRQDSGQAVGSRIALAGFERVEVVRSPGSAIYGADAVGGVINLVSNKQLDNTLTLRTGEYNTHDIEWTHQHNFEEGAWRITAAHQRSDDDPDKIATADLQTVFDNVFGTDASQAPGRVDEHYAIDQINAQLDWHKLSLQVHYWNNSDKGVGSGVAAALDNKGIASLTDTQFNASYSLYNDAQQSLVLNGAYNEQQSRTFLYVFPAGTQLPIGTDGNIDFNEPVNVVTFTDGYIGTPGNNSSATDLNATYLVHLGKHDTRVQIGHQKQSYKAVERKNFGPSIIDGSQTVVDGTLTDVSNTPYVYIPPSDRDLTYLSFEDTWQISSDFRASLGMRYDQYSDVGSTFNPRINLQWHASKNITLNTYGGTAFRAPSFTELYAQNNPAGVGNPNLKPEKARTFQSGINSTIRFNKSTDVTVNIYQYKINNIIEFVSQAESGIQLASNTGEQAGWGSELIANWQFDKKLLIKGHYSYLDARDKFDNRLSDVPVHTFYIQGHYKLATHWQLFAKSKWLSERPRKPGDPREALEGYNITSLNLAWAQSRYSAALSISNAFDTDAREPSTGSLPDDYPLAGRQAMLSVSYNY
ncbi:TonB-dependent receptor [Saccharophagus degradans]|uniref:TonB-dependent receptor plug domain-containing protein n=1 Tax=Saccharophagus degradans TaxID=86304 RepID=UPI00247819F0|nr:TonB-dependent receptor [Saccharophagus degradans]WGO98777.1 TonB-dependent receptor [Saccharophagus degradans]